MAALAGAAGFAQRARRRVVARDAETFQRFALVLLIAMFLNIASGAFVRLTGSGLGCPDWPGCKGRPVPPLDYHPAIEFSNRMIALAGILAALLTYLSARKVGDRTARRLAGGVALLTFGQIPLGAVTVLFDLHPLLVMSHFLVAVVATGLAAVLFARFSAGSAAPPPRPLAWLAGGSVLVAFALIVSGAFSTAAGPHAGGVDIRRMGNLLAATYVHVRVATTYIIVAALLLLVLQYGPWRPDRWRGLALALIVLLPLQAAIGEYQWHNQLPWGVVLAHVSVAAAAWITCVCLATRVVARQ
ncbi:MAG: heme a synthase [Gaiellales bacterium]|nr:heme a synthase [Gaiellales bacterium]